MFSQVPKRYDFLNRLFTLGMDQRWRKLAAGICLENNPRRIMDLCSGTGDLAIEIAKRAGVTTEIISADFCEPMLEQARRKAARLGLEERIKFRLADAACLPFADSYFDAVGIAFGFRNLTFKNPRTEIYLKEIRRVIAPGGKLVIIETSQPDSIFLRWLVHLYLRLIVAPVGKAISGHPAAYGYLAYSARNYYRPADVRDLLSRSGFGSVRHIPLWQGIAAIHIAEIAS